MHIAILSDPNNFHTRKWAAALQAEGAKVTVLSFEENRSPEINAIRIKPVGSFVGRYTYLSYLWTGKKLKASLDKIGVDILNPLNVTPFGVWGRQSGFHPMVISALGADILEYPPNGVNASYLIDRSWANVEGKAGFLRRLKAKLSRAFYRKQVFRSLSSAELVTGDNQYLVDCMRNWFEVPVERSRLLRWGVEEALFQITVERREALREKFGIREGQKVILSPRGVKPIYQGDIILQAFQQMLEQGRKDCKFIMLSAGYEIPQAIERKASELELKHENFHFVRGVLPREEVYALWNLVDIFISAPVYDGYSAALAEGRYIGAIPIVNAIPANLELIRHGENGMVVGPFHHETLQRALEQVLSQFEDLQPVFARENQTWIRENSLLNTNAVLFLENCVKILGEEKAGKKGKGGN